MKWYDVVIVGILVVGTFLACKILLIKSKVTPKGDVVSFRPKGALYYDPEAKLWVTSGTPHSLDHYHWWLENGCMPSVDKKTYDRFHVDVKMLYIEDYEAQYFGGRQGLS